jgi:hypothetical protein
MTLGKPQIDLEPPLARADPSNRPSGLSPSTPASQLRTLDKQIRSAEYQLRVARREVASRAHVAEKLRQARIDASAIRRHLLAVAEGSHDDPGYTRSELEQLLTLYVGGQDELRFARTARRAEDVDPVDLDTDNLFAQTPEWTGSPLLTPLAGDDLRRSDVRPMPRARNVFGMRLSEEGRGRMDRGRLPRGPGRVAMEICRRVDLQCGMRQLAAPAVQTLLLRAAGWTFKEIGAFHDISPQAAQKRHHKAIERLQVILSGGADPRMTSAVDAVATKLESELIELELYTRALTGASAKRTWWARRAVKLESQLTECRRAADELVAALPSVPGYVEEVSKDEELDLAKEEALAS